MKKSNLIKMNNELINQNKRLIEINKMLLCNLHLNMIELVEIKNKK